MRLNAKANQNDWREFSQRFLVALAGMALLSLLLGLPTDPARLFSLDQAAFSPDALILAGFFLLFSLFGRPIRGWGLVTVSLLVWLVLLLRIAELGARTFAGRAFEPTFDPLLIPGLLEVATASLTAFGLWFLLLTGLALTAALSQGAVLLLAQGLRSPWQAAPQQSRLLFCGLILVPLLASGATGLLGLSWQPIQPWRMGTVALLSDMVRRAAEVGDLQSNRTDLEKRAEPTVPVGFSGLAGRDVFVIWVESYGLSALSDLRQAPLVQQRLTAMSAALTASGYRIASGLVQSPVLGGSSFLAHGTFRSGIALTSPRLETLVLANQETGLVRAFAEAGWQTMAVMPGLSRPWPQGTLWGFDTIIGKAAIGYTGPTFGWSPVPDQILLAQLDKLLPKGRQLYVEVALTASHAPWTPLPPWLDDPTKPEALVAASQRPDYTSMADAYGRSLDYSLRAVTDWLSQRLAAEEPGRPAPLILLLGDHPAVPWISGNANSYAVPLHVLSRDPDLVAIAKNWGLAESINPNPDAPLIPMQSLAGLIIAGFDRSSDASTP